MHKAKRTFTLFSTFAQNSDFEDQLGEQTIVKVPLFILLFLVPELFNQNPSQHYTQL